MGLFLTNFALLAALFRLEQLESLYYLGPLVGSGLAAILTRPSDSHRAAAGALVLWLPALVLSSMFLTVGGRGGLFLSLPEYVTRVIGIALLALAVGSSIGVVMGRLLTRSSK